MQYNDQNLRAHLEAAELDDAAFDQYLERIKCRGKKNRRLKTAELTVKYGRRNRIVRRLSVEAAR